MNAQDVLEAERLGERLGELAAELRRTYVNGDRPVLSAVLRGKIAAAAEKWLVELEPELRSVREIRPNDLANRSIAFQRLRTYTDRGSRRRMYDTEIRRIRTDYAAEILVPAKQSLRPEARPLREVSRFVATAFVGHSFADEDKVVRDCVINSLAAVGIHVETGERPSADRISEKVKRRIDRQHMFVGLFTRRDKIARKPLWTTSAWIIDEKAYALAKGKRLILLKEIGVDQIGGLHADQEYVEFDRSRLHELALNIIGMFEARATDFRG